MKINATEVHSSDGTVHLEEEEEAKLYHLYHCQSHSIIPLILPFQRDNNQKLGLCEALLEIGAWSCAQAILDRLPENFAITSPPISKALCSLIHHVIDPLYERWV